MCAWYAMCIVQAELVPPLLAACIALCIVVRSVVSSMIGVTTPALGEHAMYDIMLRIAQAGTMHNVGGLYVMCIVQTEVAPPSLAACIVMGTAVVLLISVNLLEHCMLIAVPAELFMCHKYCVGCVLTGYHCSYSELFRVIQLSYSCATTVI
jgi:hypothetical protein